MAPPNSTWQQIIQQANADPEILQKQEVIRNVQNILQTNVSVCQVSVLLVRCFTISILGDGAS